MTCSCSLEAVLPDPEPWWVGVIRPATGWVGCAVHAPSAIGTNSAITHDPSRRNGRVHRSRMRCGACHHGAICALRVANAHLLASAAPQNAGDLPVRHGREVLDVELAMVAEALSRIAAHLLPTHRTRFFDLGWCFHEPLSS